MKEMNKNNKVRNSFETQVIPEHFETTMNSTNNYIAKDI